MVERGAATDPVLPLHLSEASDEDLGRALVDGRPGAHQVAWQRFAPFVRGMVRRAFGSQADADEVVQETFLCLLRRVHTLREPKALRAFVAAVTVRTISVEHRRRRVRFCATAEDDEREANGFRIWTDPHAKRAVMSLELLVARLRKRDRQAFILRFVSGMRAAEIGEALGVSVPTARRSFSRARKRIGVWASRDPFLSDYLDAASALG